MSPRPAVPSPPDRRRALGVAVALASSFATLPMSAAPGRPKPANPVEGSGRAADLGVLMSRTDAATADLASYYRLHMALLGGVAWSWSGDAAPRRRHEGVVQVGVGKDRCYALTDGGALLVWPDATRDAHTLMRGVRRFAAGDSGWFAIDRDAVLWHGSGTGTPRRVAQGVSAACIGDGADYYVTFDGDLFVRGLAHRGQYGDGRLQATPGFVATARDVADVRAHTGHAILLTRQGVVMGTGGNRFGPLSAHGLGDKADRWGPIFDDARAIATGSRHSLALRFDGSLWIWGQGFAIEPQRWMDGVQSAAAGDTTTLAFGADARLWQWEPGERPRAVQLS